MRKVTSSPKTLSLHPSRLWPVCWFHEGATKLRWHTWNGLSTWPTSWSFSSPKGKLFHHRLRSPHSSCPDWSLGEQQQVMSLDSQFHTVSYSQSRIDVRFSKTAQAMRNEHLTVPLYNVYVSVVPKATEEENILPLIVIQAHLSWSAIRGHKIWKGYRPTLATPVWSEGEDKNSERLSFFLEFKNFVLSFSFGLEFLTKAAILLNKYPNIVIIKNIC